MIATTMPAIARDHNGDRDGDRDRGGWHYEEGWHHEHDAGGAVHGAPCPIAGAGLPILAIGYGVYWLVRRYRNEGKNQNSR